jgi:hypothetical protein
MLPTDIDTPDYVLTTCYKSPIRRAGHYRQPGGAWLLSTTRTTARRAAPGGAAAVQPPPPTGSPVREAIADATAQPPGLTAAAGPAGTGPRPGRRARPPLPRRPPSAQPASASFIDRDDSPGRDGADHRPGCSRPVSPDRVIPIRPKSPASMVTSRLRNRHEARRTCGRTYTLAAQTTQRATKPLATDN